MDPDEQLRQEFNRWALAGRGSEMERDHTRITERTIDLMAIGPRDRILDLGCGDGWTCRRLAAMAPEGLVVGLDVSDEMVRLARIASRDLDNVIFLNVGVTRIPWKEDFFSHAISVEAFYFFPDPRQALREVLRVLAPSGRFFMLINLYADNADSLVWADRLGVPVTVLPAAEWRQLFDEAGFRNIEDRQVPDDRPVPDDYTGGRWFRDAEQLRRFRETGALLVTGEKTEPTTAAGK